MLPELPLPTHLPQQARTHTRPPSLDLLVDCVFIAARAVLAELNPLWVITAVLLARVPVHPIPPLVVVGPALRALQRDDHAHPLLTRHTPHLLAQRRPRVRPRRRHHRTQRTPHRRQKPCRRPRRCRRRQRHRDTRRRRHPPFTNSPRTAPTHPLTSSPAPPRNPPPHHHHHPPAAIHASPAYF